MNKHLGFCVADFMAILSLSLLIFMNQPNNQVVRHKIVSFVDGSKLIRFTDGKYQVWKGMRWNEFHQPLHEKLVIQCDESAPCLEMFSAKSDLHDHLLIILPERNKHQALQKFYNECAINQRCTDMTITHSDNEVQIQYQPSQSKGN